MLISMPKSPQVLACTVMLVLGACSGHQVTLPTAPATAPSNSSYADLEPGSTLNIIMPLLKSGGFRSDWRAQQVNPNTIEVRADDLLGYTTIQYAILGRNRRVLLQFVSAAETKDGKTTPLSDPPRLPFELPRRSQYVRLVYLVRVSRADHNMAIVASKYLDRLNAFTSRFLQDPGICKSSGEISCSWVPVGIAVRLEHR
jgi:hypothetical protein